MRLSDLTQAVGALRGAPIGQVRDSIADLLPELRQLAADGRVAAGVRTDLVLRAARAIDPTTSRPDSPTAALAALERLAAQEPGPGRPPIGPPTTIRLTAAAYEAIDEIARAAGHVDGDGEPRRAPVIRVLVDEALIRRGQGKT